MKIEREILEKLVRQAGAMFFDRQEAGTVKEKGKADFVTQVDFQVQTFLFHSLREYAPEIQFMGEEKDNSEIDFNRPVWILDPVDGTTNLIHDCRHSAISLAFYEEGALQLGIVYQPYTDEMYVAERGKGASLNGKEIHVSHTDTLERSLIAIGTCPYKHEWADENFRIFQKVFMASSDIRRLGSAALDLAYVAAGRNDAFFERELKPWDYAAGLLLVEEAGGRVTKFDGTAVDFGKPSQILASNGKIGEAMQHLLIEQ